MKKKQQKIGILLLTSALAYTVSCRSADNTTIDDNKKAFVKINLLGVETEKESIKIASVEKSVSSPTIQQTIPFDGRYSITATLSPIYSTLTNDLQASVTPFAGSIKTNGLTNGVIYKLVVYDSKGNYVDEKTFTHGNDNSGFSLDSGKNYTFVAYSVNSSSQLPAINTTKGNSLANAKLSTISEDLMSFKKNITLKEGSNNIDVILKHRFSNITTILDATGIGNITNVNAAITPTNTSADLSFSNYNTLTYNGLNYTGTKVNFLRSKLNKPIVTSEPTLLISDNTSSGQLNINSLTIGNTTRNNLKLNNLKITPGVKYDLNLTLNGELKTIRILSIVPDSWNGNLSDGLYTTIARSKLNDKSNFGPTGTVRIKGFDYDTMNIGTADEALISAAIDDADIIWIGYVALSYLPVGSPKRAVIERKIAEKKKFFFIGNDNYNGGFFPGKSNFAGYRFDYFGFQTTQVSPIDGAGPTLGIFGTVSSSIQQTRAVGKITNYPSGSIPFLTNTDGSINAVAGDNFITTGDTNWYYNYEAADGFYGDNSRCTSSASSILFCNIFEKAINYLKSNP